METRAKHIPENDESTRKGGCARERHCVGRVPSLQCQVSTLMGRSGAEIRLGALNLNDIFPQDVNVNVEKNQSAYSIRQAMMCFSVYVLDLE